MKRDHLNTLTSLVAIPVLCASFGSLVSCGDDKAKAKAGDSSSVAATESKFDKLSSDLKSVLTADQVKEFTGVDADIKTKVLDHKDYANVRYSWPSDRTITIEVAGMKVTNKESNKVQISKPRVLKQYGSTSIQTAFNNAYRVVTPEEMAKAMKAINDVKKRKEEAAGVTKTETKTETEKNAESSLTSALTKNIPKQEYLEIEGLGDAAKWEKSGKDLYILDGNKVLNIKCNISADDKVCLDAAKKIAAHIYSNL